MTEQSGAGLPAEKKMHAEGTNACEYAVEMIGITKRFPGIVANDNITLQLKKGEIHALLGENGAGKSTLMSVLFGLYHPEEGEIRKDGKTVEINDPNDANALGIGMVHQHFKLVEIFSVLDNIILGVEPTNSAGFLKKTEARRRVVELSEKYGLRIEPDALISDITVGMQQRTEILKMLYRNNEILIFDEPTAVLTPQEIDELMEIMRSLAAEGKSILFISHKLNEIMAVADRCTVLRKGRCIGTVDVKNTTKEELSRMMVGRDVDFVVHKDEAKPKEIVLSAEGVCVESKLHKHLAVKNVSFNVRAGEIVCIAGIDGNGQTELVEILTGLKKATHGAITMNGHDAYNKTPRQLFDMGISSIPADRHKHGLVLDFSVEDNLILQNADEKPYSNHGALNFKAIDEHARELIEKYDIRPRGCEHEPAGDLSGGNQQKVIIAREVTNDKDLLIAVNPTRGLDVGAIEYVHKYIVDQRNKHKAVLLVSFELDEVMSLSDRIDVIFEGKIVGSVRGSEADEKQLGLMMAGGSAHEE